MKIKRIFKITWISVLSTFILVLSQNLTSEGFQGVNTIKMSFVDVPFVYLIINFSIFVALTILFIFFNKFIPSRKLLKGVIYSMIISILWIALRFQPMMVENFKKHLVDSIVFIIPMVMYGIFLGYLAEENKVQFKFERRQLSYLIISMTWIVFHIIYMIIARPAQGLVLYYLIWLVTTSLIISIVFGAIYEMYYLSKFNGFFITSISVFLIFISYYGYRYTLTGSVDIELFIRVALDVFSVVLAIQLLEFYFNRFTNKKLKEV